ncbi:MAG: MFS transporter [Acidobacteriota bacterium]|nr:MFS transporter [Acidobacteriota bacterium]
MADNKRTALWTPSFTLLTVANFGVSMSFFLLMSTMASYAVAAFAASNTQAGLTNSVFILGAMAARIVAGRAIELKGYRPVMVVSVIAHFLTVVAYLFTSTLPFTLFVRTVHGFAFGVSQTAIAGAVMAKVPPSRRGEGSGWFTTGMSLATGLAPFAGLMLYNSAWGQTGVFVMTAIMSGMAMVLSLLAIRHLDSNPNSTRAQRGSGNTDSDVRDGGAPAGANDERRRDGERASAGRPGNDRAGAGRLNRGRKIRPRPVSLDGFFDRRAFPIATVVALAAFSFAAALTFLDAFAKEAGLADAATWYFVVYAVVILVSRPIAGIAQDRYGDDVVVIPLLIAEIVGMVLTALATNGAMLLIGGALLGLGYGTLVSAGQAIAVSEVGAVRAGLAVSSFFLIVDAGTGMAPLILGALVDPLGYRKMMLVAAGFGVLALVIYLARNLKKAS